MKAKRILIAIVSVLLLTGCAKDVFEPEIENIRHLDPNAYNPSDARFPYGILATAYTRLPNQAWLNSDVATDNAVTNELTNGFLRITSGIWSPIFNPFDRWSANFAAIQYINIMLEEVDKVRWVTDPVTSSLFARRIRGESYALRAIFYQDLLRLYGGVATNGQLLGVPLLLSSQNATSDFNQPRASYDDCLRQIYKDLDSAVNLLPLDYGDVPEGATLPAKFGSVTRDQYNVAFGNNFKGGMVSGRIALGVKSKTSIIAASPAYSTNTVTTWQDAANDAAALLNMNNGLSGLATNGLNWYGANDAAVAEINALAVGFNQPEVLWRGSYNANSSDIERNNFPPTLFGNGRINPTQNLVDAFPASNGYPISSSSSNYNPADPYNNRDPRLKLFILVNGGTIGTSTTPINTAADAPTNDGLNKVSTSTRTGYYLRKLSNKAVGFTSTTASGQRRYKPFIRYTEVFLNYAEAANEAWGPTVAGGNASFSAYDVIKAIRRRAGIGLTNEDAYLESIANNKDEMRKLIRNERRLELCFEDLRFWDLRRWKVDLTETAKGVSIANNTYSFINVEDRKFNNSFMIYGPLPNGEVLKFNALLQNQGW